MTIESRFDAKVAKSDTCWTWTAYVDKSGYGRFGIGRTVVYAHRWAYERHVGPIPAGMVIDHVCHVRHCVNPAHLHVVTPKQNIENLDGANRSNKSSGIRGVSWSKAVKKWHVHLRHHGETVHGGYYENLSDAEAAAVELRNTHFTNNLSDHQETA